MSDATRLTQGAIDPQERPGQPSEALPPGSTIGVLGGGQLGRMVGLAARRLGYRLAILDPDPECPAAAVADEQVVAAYDDALAASRLLERCAVLTYELEHVDPGVVDSLAPLRPVRPGPLTLRTTRDRLLERRFLVEQGVPTAPGREVGSEADLAAGAEALGYPLRLKAATGGYDGRSQVRLAGPPDLAAAWTALGSRAPLLLEQELDFACELSVVTARGLDGRVRHFPVGRNRHDEGILVETLMPAPPPVDDAVAAAARALAERIVVALDAIGVVTVEMFLLRDGSLAVNELAPRVHNSGHATEELCVTSQFEQHVRAITGLPLGSTSLRAPGTTAAMLNLLGSGPQRPARLEGVEAALADPDLHLHLYDKRRVFERRKMGHLTVVAGSPEAALQRARVGLARLRWADPA